MINVVPTDTDDPYLTDDLIDDQEYPSNDQGRVMEPDRGMMKIMVMGIIIPTVIITAIPLLKWLK
jgi:hypothetical protein